MTPSIVRLPKNGEVWELYDARFLVLSADSSQFSPFQIIKLQSQDNGKIHEILLADFLSIDFHPEQCT